VLLSIEQDQTTAYVHVLINAEACDAAPGVPLLMLSSAEISLRMNERREIRLTFKAGASHCRNTSILQSDDFRPATPEVHMVPYDEPSVPIDR
jgi:hypothetical protein